MFSFFKSSSKNKPSPTETPTDANNGLRPSDRSGDDFIMVEPKNPAPLYPVFDHFGGGSLPYPNRPAPQAPLNVMIF